MSMATDSIINSNVYFCWQFINSHVHDYWQYNKLKCLLLLTIYKLKCPCLLIIYLKVYGFHLTSYAHLPWLLTKPSSAKILAQLIQRKHSGCQDAFIALMTRPLINSPKAKIKILSQTLIIVHLLWNNIKNVCMDSPWSTRILQFFLIFLQSLTMTWLQTKHCVPSLIFLTLFLWLFTALLQNLLHTRSPHSHG